MKSRFLFVLMAMMVGFFAKAQNSVPLNEGFEGDVFPPHYWLSVTVAGDEYATPSRSVSDGLLSSHSGDYYAAFFYSWDDVERYLITPKLLPEEGYSLVFWITAEVFYLDPDYQTFTVELSTTGVDLSAFNTVLHTFNAGDFGDEYEWIRFAFDLSDYAGQEVHIAFHDIQMSGAGVYLDDISGVNYEIPNQKLAAYLIAGLKSSITTAILVGTVLPI